MLLLLWLRQWLLLLLNLLWHPLLLLLLLLALMLKVLLLRLCELDSCPLDTIWRSHQSDLSRRTIRGSQLCCTAYKVVCIIPAQWWCMHTTRACNQRLLALSHVASAVQRDLA